MSQVVTIAGQIFGSRLKGAMVGVVERGGQGSTRERFREAFVWSWQYIDKTRMATECCKLAGLTLE